MFKFGPYIFIPYKIVSSYVWYSSQQYNFKDMQSFFFNGCECPYCCFTQQKFLFIPACLICLSEVVSGTEPLSTALNILIFFFKLISDPTHKFHVSSSYILTVQVILPLVSSFCLASDVIIFPQKTNFTNFSSCPLTTISSGWTSSFFLITITFFFFVLMLIAKLCITITILLISPSNIKHISTSSGYVVDANS